MVEEKPEEEQRELVKTTYEGLNVWDTWTEEEKKARQEELHAKALALPKFSEHTDEFRDPERSSYYGGFELRSAE